MKRVAFILVILVTNICKGPAQNLKIGQIAYESFVTWFSPHMGDAYLHYPLFGSARISKYTLAYPELPLSALGHEEYVVRDGRLISYIHDSKTESNGIDFYIATEGKHHVQYSDTAITITCDFRKIGDRSGLRDTWSHLHTYLTGDVLAINDSTFAISENKWTLIANEQHWSNQTETENDLWNIEVVFEGGFPIKIKRGKDVMHFKYLKFDKFGNWTEREVVNENGLSRIQMRSIKYSCELCGGKGYVSGRCMKCHGTGRCPINRNGGPDDVVGICSWCGGSGKGVQKCKRCN